MTVKTERKRQYSTASLLTEDETNMLCDVIMLETEREKLLLAHTPAMNRSIVEWSDGLSDGSLRPRKFIEFRDLDKLGLAPEESVINSQEFTETAKILIAEARQSMNESINTARVALKRIPLRLKIIEKMMEQTGRVNPDLAAAREELVVRNTGLVHKIALKLRKLAGDKMEYEDILQEGLIGLNDAATLFRTGRGAKFSTYAMSYIDGYIRRSITERADIVRLPQYMNANISALRRAVKKLGAAATDEELAAETKMSVAEIKRVRDSISLKNISSLDMPLKDNDGGEDGSATVMDMITDENAKTGEDLVLEKSFKESVEQVLECLSLKEQQILRLRFGLGGCREHTLEDVGQRYHVTRERIRQIQDKSLSTVYRHLKRNKLSPDSF